MLSVMLSVAFVLSASLAVMDQPSLNPVRYTALPGAPEFVLVEKGRACAALVQPDRSEDVWIPGVQQCAWMGEWPEHLRFAGAMSVHEIRTSVARATGVELPVVRGDEPIPDGLSPVFVGLGKRARSCGFDDVGLPPEGFRIVCNGKALAIIGAPKGDFCKYDGVASTLWGAYDFLERFVGVRFYYHTEQGVSVEPRERIAVPAVDYMDWPRYNQRLAYTWRWMDLQGNCSIVSALRYRSGSNGWGSGTIYQHVPSDFGKMFDPVADADCFEVGADGKSFNTKPAMPCFGNPKTVDRYMEFVRGWYAHDPKARAATVEPWCNPGERSLGFCPADHPVRCECKHCLSYPTRRDGLYWEQRGEVMGHFAQELSWRVAREYPGKRFYYLPYYNYTDPPKSGVFADNAWFRLCFMFGQSTYLDPLIRRKYDEWTRGWIEAGHGHRLSGYLYGWPGPVKNLPMLFQSPHALKAFFSDMRDRVEGWFVGDSLPSPACQAFSNYCLFRLMWNPDFNVDAALAEMYKRLFGPAAGEMSDLYGRLTRRFETCDWASLEKTRYGAPYRAPVFTEKEVLSTFCSDEDAAAIERGLKSAEAKVLADGAAKVHFNYFARAFRTLLERRAVFKSGAGKGEKMLRARPVAGDEVPVVDGRIDEPVWETADAGTFDRRELVLGATNPDVPTEVRVVRCDKGEQKGLYVALRMAESRMADRRIEKSVWSSDGVELFFDASIANGELGPDFVHYGVSSDGAVASHGARGAMSALHKDVQCAVSCGEKEWAAELFIPYEVLFAGRKRQSSIRCNFIRNRLLANPDGTSYEYHSLWRSTGGEHNGDVSQFGEVILD